MIHQNLNLGSPQVQILHTVSRRFPMVRIPQPYYKNNSSIDECSKIVKDKKFQRPQASFKNEILQWTFKTEDKVVNMVELFRVVWVP